MAGRADERFFQDKSARTLVDVCATLASKCEGPELTQIAQNLTAVAEWFAEVISWQESMPAGVSAPSYRVDDVVYAEIVYTLAWADTLFSFKESGVRKELSDSGLSFIHADIRQCASEEGMKKRNPRTSRAVTLRGRSTAEGDDDVEERRTKGRMGRPLRDTQELWRIAQGQTNASMQERFKALNTLHRRFQKILKGNTDLDV